VKVARGRFSEIHWLLYPLSLVFVAYFALHPIEEALGIG
jgi:AGZA family xanthine/uracil permease-like MFS transporter